MKKKIRLIGILVLTAVILLTGCATTSIGPINGAYPNTPDGQCKISSSFTIDTFDGVAANWPAGDDIVIPAGTHTIRCVANRQLTIRDRSLRRYDPQTREYITILYDADVLYYKVIWEVSYEFQKGKSYSIYGRPGSLSFKDGVLTVPEGAEFVLDKNRYSTTVKPKVDVREISSSNGGLFVTPEATGLLGAGLAYGGVTLGQFGERFGIGILGGKMDLKLVGLGQVGMLVKFEEGVPFAGIHYNFGGLFEYQFPKLSLGAGGGMWGSLLPYYVRDESLNNEEKLWEHIMQPYLEVNMALPLRLNGRIDYVIYFHYYPSFGEEWHRTFGFGCKINLISF